MAKYIELLSGKLSEKGALESSAGVADAGKIVQTDSSGKLDLSLMPVGIGPDTAMIVASEDIGAGKYVNIFDDAGTPKIRLADNSNSRDAHGFLKDSALTGANALVYFEGGNDDLSGLLVGARYYLGTAGGVTATPPVSPAAQIHQFVGIAISATTINTDIDDCIKLA